MKVESPVRNYRFLFYGASREIVDVLWMILELPTRFIKCIKNRNYSAPGRKQILRIHPVRCLLSNGARLDTAVS